MSIPKQSQALIVVDKGKVAVQTVDIPQAGEGEIVVKVEAVALNPTVPATLMYYHRQHWKHRDFVSPPGAGLGCDFSGRVVQLGQGVHNVKEGDRVAGFIHGGKDEKHGSFAGQFKASEYLKTEATLVWKVPDSVDAEEAAALGGIAPHTAFQALNLRLGIPQPSKPISTSESLLVWGGSTSVGLYAVQLAALAGYRVVATSSPKNFDLVKKYGASAVFDYADDATPSKIQHEFPELALALDTISERGTTLKTAQSFKNKGHIVVLLPPSDEGLDNYPDVKVEFTLVYTVLGKEFNFAGNAFFPAMPKDKKAIEEWSEYVPSLIESGKFKANPLWRQVGGLAKVNDGMNLLKEGKNSAQKVTFNFGA
ncbi:BZ3500_MvSof-1268-A1-R1_Chr1-3g02029 [Microbotryum saponariae]|uniref:BZ3500_MvSof-1268-A1-R1_Chr1-3g02029 protein n=1 Tax=Microbotryum saponariae TaxID=289078 RepID=A0A2X0L4B6_9BASI|nr:BZ3500_MvSof-1268-A1-R1_Chr1-3g02029 [Microbotryum saponariae]SCZ95193.1 BZ3501_MvSof-1269-A2-R1_Chr1-3g01631 [Microbotryum saponariae]